MAKITTGFAFGLNIKQATFARLLAEGQSDEDIILAIFGSAMDAEGRARERTPSEKSQITKTLRKWSKLPGFDEAYRSVVREIAKPYYGRALQRLGMQIDDPNPWVAQGAAREVLTRFGPAILGEDDKEITVRVEGMPPLGMPSGSDTVASLPAGEDA